MSRKMTSVVQIHLYACSEEKEEKNVKRPDSPDIDREGGKPTKMGYINNASASLCKPST